VAALWKSALDTGLRTAMPHDVTTDTASALNGGDKWEPVDGDEGVYQNGHLRISLDGNRYVVKDVRDGSVSLAGELPDDHDSLYFGFHAILADKLAGCDLTAAGLCEWCAWAEREADPPEPFDLQEAMAKAYRDIWSVEAKVEDAKAAARQMEDPIPAGSFAERVSSRRVDLVKIVEEGIEPASYIPGSGGTLIVGARHLVTAPRKVGKSIAWEATAIRIVLAGGRVVILDRENGKRTYALRINDIMAARELSPEQRETLPATSMKNMNRSQSESSIQTPSP
jgi:hypothetical protein